MPTITLLALIIGCALATSTDPKINERKDAADGQFPYQVSLRHALNNYHFCGGSIISSEWILTAASCVQSLTPSSIIAVVGSNLLSSGGLGYGISQILSHNGYNPQSNVNDIAVLRINGNIELGGLVGIVDLAPASIDGGLTVTFSGWGYCDPNKNPNSLEYVELQSITVAQCQQRLEGYPVYSTHQCTTTTSPDGQGSCKGDSGGPLTHGSPPQQVGVLSWGIPYVHGYPDVFTSVTAYRSWIKSTTGV